MQLREDIPNFSWEEVLSGFAPDERFWLHMQNLQKLRDWWEAPLRITSGFRSPKHNEAIGGASKSQHMIFATDIVPNVKSPHLSQPTCSAAKSSIFAAFLLLPEALDLIADKAEELGFTGIGRYDIFIHLDMRPKVARWDERTKFWG